MQDRYCSIRVSAAEFIAAAKRLEDDTNCDTVDIVIADYYHPRGNIQQLTFENDGVIECIVGYIIDYCNENINIMKGSHGKDS